VGEAALQFLKSPKAIQELGDKSPGFASVNLDAYASPGQRKAVSVPVFVSQVGGTIRAVGATVSRMSPGGVLPETSWHIDEGDLACSIGTCPGREACRLTFWI
jgi:hypothetical protein